jgi:hypothetical protein
MTQVDVALTEAALECAIGGSAGGGIRHLQSPSANQGTRQAKADLAQSIGSFFSKLNPF